MCTVVKDNTTKQSLHIKDHYYPGFSAKESNVIIVTINSTFVLHINTSNKKVEAVQTRCIPWEIGILKIKTPNRNS